MLKYVILPCHEGTKDFHYKLYSKDLKTYYGDFYSQGEVYRKIDALNKVELERGLV